MIHARTAKQNSERYKRAYQMHLDGKDLREIAHEFGVKRETAKIYVLRGQRIASSPEPDDWFLNLSERTRNAIKNQGLDREDKQRIVESVKSGACLEWPNLGKKSFNELKDVLDLW